jgi:hypothetical protein
MAFSSVMARPVRFNPKSIATILDIKQNYETISDA